MFKRFWTQDPGLEKLRISGLGWDREIPVKSRHRECLLVISYVKPTNES